MRWFETVRRASHPIGIGSNTEWCRSEGAAISEGCAQAGQTNCRGWQRTAIPSLSAQVSMSGRSFILYRAHNLLMQQHSVRWQGLTAGDSDSAADTHSRQKFANHFLKQCTEADVPTHTTAQRSVTLSTKTHVQGTMVCGQQGHCVVAWHWLGTDRWQNWLKVQSNCKWCVDWCVHCGSSSYVCTYGYVCMYVCVCMHVCMCACMYLGVHIYIYIYVCVCVYLCVYMYVCMHVLCIRVCIYVYLCVCTYVSMCMYECIYVFMCMYVCIHVNVCIRIYVYGHVHTAVHQHHW